MNLITSPEKATLLIPIPEIAIPRRVVEYAESNNYFPKSEFHVTLLSFQNGKKVKKALHSQSDCSFRNVVELAESYNWGIVFDAEYYILERTIPEFILNGQLQTPAHTRRSIIQKVTVPNMAKFFEKLGEMLVTPFEVPVAHITLFTWSDYELESRNGIAVNSETDFEKYKIGVLH